MKKCVLAVLIVFIFLTAAVDGVDGFYAANIKSIAHERYPKEDIVKYSNILKIISDKGDLAAAEEIANLIGDQEIRWMSLYAIAADGYAPRGEIKKAATIINNVVKIIGDVSGIKKWPEELKIYTQVIHDKMYGDLIVADIESKLLDVDIKVENAVFLVNQIERLYYRLMAIEKSILRFSDKNIIEKFLSEIGYKIGLNMDAGVVGEIVSSYYDQNHHLLIVIYSEDKREAMRVFHKLTPEQRFKWLKSR